MPKMTKYQKLMVAVIRECVRASAEKIRPWYGNLMYANMKKDGVVSVKIEAKWPEYLHEILEYHNLQIVRRNEDYGPRRILIPPQPLRKKKV